MIAKLTGRLDGMAEGHCIIDVGGVGYLVFASNRTLRRLGRPGAEVAVLIETHVREDHIHLYGFADAGEKHWFTLLTTVQGVGARVALAILSVAEPDKLMLAISAQDKAPLVAADGVGPKLAARILAELKDKVDPLTVDSAAAAVPGDPNPSPAPGNGLARDAVSALVNLGYGRSEAFEAVTKAQGAGSADDLGALIRAGLKELAP